MIINIIIFIIISFITMFMKLREWIDISKLKYRMLSLNINAIDILKENINKLDWSNISLNVGVIELIKDNLHRISWFNLSSNLNAISILK